MNKTLKEQIEEIWNLYIDDLGQCHPMPVKRTDPAQGELSDDQMCSGSEKEDSPFKGRLGHELEIEGVR